MQSQLSRSGVLLADGVDLASYSIVSALRSLALDPAIEEKFPNWDERLNALMVLLLKGLSKLFFTGNSTKKQNSFYNL